MNNDDKSRSEEYAQIWQMFRDSLSPDIMSETQANLWFGDAYIAGIDENSVHIIHPSDFKCTTITRRFMPLLKEQLSAILGFDIDIKIYSDQDNPFIPKIEDENENRNENPIRQVIDETDPKVNDDIEIDINTNLSYTFDSFVVGSTNKFACAACRAVAENSISTYNPLFIYGPSGVGKTHLLWSIIDYIKKNRSSSRIVYVKGDDFTNQMIESIRRETTKEFRNKYRNADILLIDDIQFISGKISTQEEFFHTFNALYENGKQIVLTSDRHPHEIITLEERLQSRFESGLIADIQPPDYELRIAIMKNKAEAMHIKIPDEVITFLAESLHSNVRQLEGTIKKLSAQSLLNGMPITVELAYKSIADLVGHHGAEPVGDTVERILKKVSERKGVTVEDIKSKKRNKEIAAARHISAYLIRNLTNMSLPAIGKELSRDHSTIMSSIEAVEKEIESNPSYKLEIDMLTKEIKENS